MITSKFLSLDAQDWLNGLVSAVAGAIFALIAPNLVEVATHPATAVLTFDVAAIWHTAVATGLLYLGNKFTSKAKKVTPAE